MRGFGGARVKFRTPCRDKKSAGIMPQAHGNICIVFACLVFLAASSTAMGLAAKARCSLAGHVESCHRQVVEKKPNMSATAKVSANDASSRHASTRQEQ